MTITTEKSSAEIATELVSSFTKRIDGLKAAIAAEQGRSFVFCWPEYSLGVKMLENGKPRTVGVEDADITHFADSRTFTNGQQKRARLMPRIDALKIALENTSASLSTIKAAIAKQEA